MKNTAELGILGSIQLLNSSASIQDESFARMIPLEQQQLANRWRDLIDSGIYLIANTDVPWCCTPWRTGGEGESYTGRAMDALHQGVTRTTYDGRVPELWQASQRLTVQEAFEMLTIRGAYAAHQEDVIGSIVAGKYADFVVLSANPLEVAVDAIPEIDVLATIIGGHAEFCASGAEGLCP